MKRGARHPAVSPGLGAAALWFVSCAGAPAQEPAAPAAPDYPHVTLSTWYEVDPAWPRKPADAAWGQTPGVAVDAHDHVWVYTRASPPVQVYDADGRFIRAWGDENIKTAHHIKIDGGGNVWVADLGNHVVMQFTPEGRLLRTLGVKGEAGADETHLNRPTDMAVAPDGDVFVTDGYGNNRVVHFDRNGKFVKAWGRLGTGPGEFSIPHAIARDSRGRLYVADRNNARVQVFDPDGRFLAEWRDLVVPWGLCVMPSDDIWVCGSSPMPWRKEDKNLGCPPKDQVFMRFNTEGKLLQQWTVPKGADGQEKPGECNWLHGMAVDSKGNIYAGDIKGQRAQKFVKR